MSSKYYIEKLPQKITRDDHTVAEAKWRMSYLHFLHFPSTKTTLQSAHVGKKWLKRFEMYLAAHDVKDATRKRAVLVYSAGEEVSDIFETLPDPGEEKDYAKAVTALNTYFQPKVNKTYEIYMFRNASQNSGESLDSYCIRLRRLAQTCEFANEDEEIKSHIVVSCLSS